jgi:hypothetical protein
MNRLSLRNNRLKFEIAGKIRDRFRGICKIDPNLINENRRISTCKPVGLANTTISTNCALKITGGEGERANVVTKHAST